MINLLLLLPDYLTAGNAMGAQVTEEFSGSGTIGFVVLAIIVGPVIILTSAAMLGRPRTFRVPGLFAGSFILLVGALIVSFAIAGWLLGFIVPQ